MEARTNIDENHKEKISRSFIGLYDVLSTLRAPGGCPWDQKQTPKSFYKNIIEEAYEFIDAVHNDDLENCKEEIGDMFLVITMLAIMYEEDNHFNLPEILDNTTEKLIRRHPHVFDNESAENPEEVIKLWDAIKENVEGKKTSHENPYKKIPKSYPPLERAEEIQKIARKKGFDWPDATGAIDKVDEELHELKAAIGQDDHVNIEEEIGDLLFSVVNISRLLKKSPHIALHKTNEKFIKRYNDMVVLYSEETGQEFTEASFEQMDEYWEKAKKL